MNMQDFLKMAGDKIGQTVNPPTPYELGPGTVAASQIPAIPAGVGVHGLLPILSQLARGMGNVQVQRYLDSVQRQQAGIKNDQAQQRLDMDQSNMASEAGLRQAQIGNFANEATHRNEQDIINNKREDTQNARMNDQAAAGNRHYFEDPVKGPMVFDAGEQDPAKQLRQLIENYTPKTAPKSVPEQSLEAFMAANPGKTAYDYEKSLKTTPESTKQLQTVYDDNGAHTVSFDTKSGQASPFQLPADTTPGLSKTKPTEAPVQIKNGARAGATTKDQIATVRKYIAEKPQLVGPVIGRLEQSGQATGVGTYGLQSPEDEQDAATLAGHLVTLFANEFASQFPGGGRSPEFAKIVKQVSANIHQNPSLIEGFLKSGENNANMALQRAHEAGYTTFDHYLTPGYSSPGLPAAPLPKAAPGMVIIGGKQYKVIP